MTIHERIKSVRAAFGLSQKAFGQRIGFSQSYVADIEAGRSKPSFKLIQAVSLAFSVSKGWLMNGVIKAEHPDPMPPITAENPPNDPPENITGTLEVTADVVEIPKGRYIRLLEMLLELYEERLFPLREVPR